MKNKPQTFFSLLFCFAMSAVITMQAQTQIYVAVNGNDTNPGTISAPKRTFQAAHDAVLNGGEVIALTNGDYGKVNIIKGITIRTAPGVVAIVNAPISTPGITIAVSATVFVKLKGLSIEGSANNGTGILANSGEVSLEDCTVRNLNTGINSQGGFFGALDCFRCSFSENQTSVLITSDIGIKRGFLKQCSIEDDFGAGVVVSASNNESINFTIDDCQFLNNETEAISATGAGAIVRVSNSSIMSNATGVLASNGGQVLSRRNNTLEDNVNGNTFPGTYRPK